MGVREPAVRGAVDELVEEQPLGLLAMLGKAPIGLEEPAADEPRGEIGDRRRRPREADADGSDVRQPGGRERGDKCPARADHSGPATLRGGRSQPAFAQPDARGLAHRGVVGRRPVGCGRRRDHVACVLARRCISASLGSRAVSVGGISMPSSPDFRRPGRTSRRAWRPRPSRLHRNRVRSRPPPKPGRLNGRAGPLSPDPPIGRSGTLKSCAGRVSGGLAAREPFE